MKRRWSFNRRLAVFAAVVASLNLVVDTIGMVGDFTRDAPAASTREERADAGAAQALLTSSAAEVLKKASEAAEASRAAEAARAAEATRRENEAARPAPPAVEVARVRKAGSSGRRGLASDITFDGTTPARKRTKVRPEDVFVLSRRNDTYTVVPSGRDRYAGVDPLRRGAGSRYDGAGAPTYSALDYPVSSQRVTVSAGGEFGAVKPPPAPRPKPDGYVARFFWHVDNLDFPEKAGVYVGLLYLGWGFLQIMGAVLGGLFGHGPGAKA